MALSHVWLGRVGFLHSILILEKRSSFDTPDHQLALNLCRDTGGRLPAM